MRLCEHTPCMNELIRRPKERPSRFIKRRFCSMLCNNASKGFDGTPGPGRLAKVAEKAYVIEELDFLLHTDTPESLTKRLGYSNMKALSRMLYREGREDLGNYFDYAANGWYRNDADVAA